MEINLHAGSMLATQCSFNEATAISCGDRRTILTRARKGLCFNEATAISCGDPGDFLVGAFAMGAASTRPQRLAVEIYTQTLDVVHAKVASTRPQRLAVEISTRTIAQP